MDANELKTRCEAIGTAARAMAVKACNETRISISEVLKTSLELAGRVADGLAREAYDRERREQEERWRAEDERLYGHHKVGEYDDEQGALD